MGAISLLLCMYSGSKVSTLCKWNRTLLSLEKQQLSTKQTELKKAKRKKKENGPLLCWRRIHEYNVLKISIFQENISKIQSKKRHGSTFIHSWDESCIPFLIFVPEFFSLVFLNSMNECTV
jgi:hypothetical protein